MDKYLIYKYFNSLYKKSYFVYKPLYFLYKHYSDGKKIKLLTEKIKQGMTILDIGANIGFYTILFSKHIGKDGTVHAFEPEALNYKYLTANMKNCKNAFLNNCAVGSKSEKLRLYYSNELNVDHQTYDIGENRKYTEIECIAIDDYFKNNETVDLVKIDIQGYDYFALSGMKETLKRSSNVTILGEFWPYGLFKAGVDPGDYINLLKELEFDVKIFNLDNTDYQGKIKDKFFYTDYLAYKGKK